MIEIWLKLESNKYPFKVKFTGKDVYDLKKEIIAELAPRLNNFTALDLGICPSAQKELLFLENTLVSDLVRTTEAKYDSPWVVVIHDRANLNTFESTLENFLPHVFALINRLGTFVRDTSCSLWDLFIVQEWPTIQWLSMLIVVEIMVLHFHTFPVWSITTSLVWGICLSYHLLSSMPEVATKHFTSSRENIREGRWYTLITSSFAHKDIDHLLRNVTAIVVTLPIMEQLMKRETVLFLFLASTASSLTSVYFSSVPSIGASGVIYAMQGYLMKISRIDVDWIPYVLEQTLFAIANSDAGIDHWAHLGGFVFGFIYLDLFGE